MGTARRTQQDPSVGGTQPCAGTTSFSVGKAGPVTAAMEPQQDVKEG